jgi:Fe-S-cluster containining protein
VNLPFLCVKCGKCCTLGNILLGTRFLVGNASDEQVKELNKRLEPYYEEYHRMGREDKDRGKLEAYLINTKCPFLCPDKTCEIYAYRPGGCQAFPKTDSGMDSEKGYCESLDRFKDLRKALLKNQRNHVYDRECFFTFKNGIKPVKMTKKQYERCIAKLIKAGMTRDELALFNYLNVSSQTT